MKQLLALSLCVALAGCDPAPTTSPAQQAAVADLVARSQQDLVFIAGGEFMMGDFGPLDVPRSRGFNYVIFGENARPLHRVVLTSYSLSRYQVTFADYQLYRQAQGLNPNPFQGRVIKPDPNDSLYKGMHNFNLASVREEIWDQLAYAEPTGKPGRPVMLPWQEADHYCRWLGQVSGLAYALPTEAQWEYAARNRGQLVRYATDNGEFEPGRNVADEETSKQARIRAQGAPGGATTPVGSYPPNPLGLYDMGMNGYEWVGDWYDSHYYQYSPQQDPQGPAQPEVLKDYDEHDYVARVVKSNERPQDLSITATRYYYKVTEAANPFDDMYFVTVRCAVNQPTPVN